MRSRGCNSWAWLTVAITVSLVGCEPDQQATRQPTEEQSEPVTYPSPSRAIPVIYPKLGPQKLLAEAQKQRILDLAREQKPDGVEIWFIQSSWYTGDPVVFLTPDHVNGRLRRGTYLIVEYALVAGDGGSRPKGNVHKNDFFQVVAPDEVDDPLENTPAIMSMPFWVPFEFSDEDIVKIVDAAYAADAVQRKQKTHEFYKEILPVLQLHVNEEHSIDVFLGWCDGPMSAHGRLINVQPEGDEFVVTSIASWFT